MLKRPYLALRCSR